MPDKEWLYPSLRQNGYTYSVLENLHYVPHVHDGIECVYVLSGELCATIDEKNYTLKKGDICLIFPQVRHSYKTPKSSNVFGFAMYHDTMPDDLRCSSSMATRFPTRFTVQGAIRHSSPKLLTTC